MTETQLPQSRLGSHNRRSPRVPQSARRNSEGRRVVRRNGKRDGNRPDREIVRRRYRCGKESTFAQSSVFAGVGKTQSLGQPSATLSNSQQTPCHPSSHVLSLEVKAMFWPPSCHQAVFLPLSSCHAPVDQHNTVTVELPAAPRPQGVCRPFVAVESRLGGGFWICIL